MTRIEQAFLYRWLKGKYRTLRSIHSTLLKTRMWVPLVTAAEELQCLAFYASKVRRLAVEIGTFNGGSTCVMSNALPEGVRLVTIDPYVADSMDPTLRGSLLIAFCNVLLHGRIGKVRFVKDYSFNVAKSWSAPIDFLWIDGSHVYEDVKRDFEDWSRFVCPGGHIIVHDSNREDLSNDREFQNGWCGPTRVCREIRGRRSRTYVHVESVKSINVFRAN